MSSLATAQIIPFPSRRPDASDLPLVELTTGSATGGLPDVVELAGDAGVITIAPVGSADPETTEAQARLARALASLDTALTEQRTAIAAWRGALADLRTTMQGLSNSVQTYRGTLESLDGKVATLRGEANQLERWADNALTVEGEAVPPAAAR